MSPADFEHFQAILAERETLLAQYLDTVGSEHPAEAEKVRGLLRQTQDALSRINDHTFGTCEVCKAEVEYHRLEVQPVRQVCLGCISKEEQASLEEELTIAGKIHRALLPQRVEAIDGYDFAVKAIAAHSVGGDYYDFLPRGNRVKVVIADSMGKGIPGGLLMSNLQGALRVLADEHESPGRLTAKLNWWLCRNVPVTKFISLACVCLGKGGSSTEVTYANAGHYPLMVARTNGQVEYLESTGGVLGVHEHFDYEERPVAMNSGDLLLLYTDGVCEARDPADRMFGAGALESFCREHRADPVDVFLDKLVAEVARFSGKSEFDDDLTAIALRKK